MGLASLYRCLALAVALAGLLLVVPMASAQSAVPLAERITFCAGCHGTDGNSVIPENPKLSGLDAGYLVRQLADFKSGKRKSLVMGGIIQLVDQSEFPALAEYFSNQKPAPGAPTDARLVAQGKEIFDEGIVGTAVPACSGCHNDDGSGTEKYPRVAGQNVAYVVQQLLNFKSGERANDSRALMQAVARRMNEKEVRAVAEYVATLIGDEQ